MKVFSPIELKVYKSSLTLTEIQRNFIIGSLLGDGNLRFTAKHHEANFTVDHGEKQKEYVWWKYHLLKDWVLTEPKEVKRIYHKDRERILTSYRFFTISHKEFTSLYYLFYRDGIKIIPQHIDKILKDNFSLAVWLMDDGNKNSSSVFLNTQYFSEAEQELLRECLYLNFGLDTTLNKHWLFRGRQLYRIRFTAVATRKLYKLVKEFIIPSMKYKFPLYPRND